MPAWERLPFMLEFKGICKRYVTQSFTQVALDSVSLSFRDNEFVAILGPSGARLCSLTFRENHSPSLHRDGPWAQYQPLGCKLHIHPHRLLSIDAQCPLYSLRLNSAQGILVFRAKTLMPLN